MPPASLLNRLWIYKWDIKMYKAYGLTITCEDNMKLMSRYPDKYFDLAVVDPEYGLDIANRNGSIGQKKGQGIITSYKSKNWDGKPAGKDYFKELFRVSKNQVIFGANYFAPHLPYSKGWLVWNKKQPEGVTFAMAELIFTSFNHSVKIISCSRAEIGNKIGNNLQKALANPFRKRHPTQKPASIYRNIFNRYTKPGFKVLDTNLGSGTILEAAIDYQLQLIACDIDLDICSDAIANIKKYTKSKQLFFN